MAEIGFVTCATTALPVGQAALSASRSPGSTHQGTQPQRLAMLCLMRDEEWTVREADVRLAEHAGRRPALRRPRVPDDPPVSRVLHRLNETALDHMLSAIVQRLDPQSGPQATVAVDATRLAPGAISPCLVKRAKDRGEGFTWRYWPPWIMVTEIDHRVILAQTARRGPTRDGALCRPPVSMARARAPMGVVLADVAFDRERHHPHVRQECPVPLDRRSALMERLISAVQRT